MIIFQYIVSAIMLAHVINCLNQNDMCKSSKNNQCKILNNKIVKCINSDCDHGSKWNTKCDSSYCSKDILTCEIFKRWNSKVKEIEINGNRNKFKLAMKNHHIFKRELSNCPVSEFEWKLSNVCTNYRKCNSAQSEMCNCMGGRLTYKCNDRFCALDEKVCDSFISLNNGTTNKFKLNKCFTYKKI